MVTEIDDGPAADGNPVLPSGTVPEHGDEPVGPMETALTALREAVGPGDVPEVDAIMAALMARINPIGEAPVWFKALIYGPAGAGKTKFSGEADNVLLVDIEKGSQTLRNHETTKHAAVLEFKSFTQLDLLLQKINEGAFPQFKTLVIDSGTTLQELTLDAIVKKAASEDASRNPFVPQLQDYNANTNQMRRLGSMLRDLPMNVIMIAQAKEVKDESTGRLLVRPAFTDKLATSLNHLFSTIGYLTVDPEGNRQLQVHPTDKITAKTRIGGLPGVIKNPSVNDLISANASTKDK